MDREDEFGLDDDAFDALPPNELQELETRAHIFASTQRSRQIQNGDSAAQIGLGQDIDYKEYGFDYDDDDIIDLNAEPISIPRANDPSNARKLNSVPHRAAPRAASYSSKAPQALVHRGFKPPSFVNRGSQPPRATNGSINGSQAPHIAKIEVEPRAPSRPDVDVQALLERVEALQRENEHLLRTSNDAQKQFQTKAGEAALVRRKLETSKFEHEKRMQQLQTAHLEALDKQKTQLDLAIREKRQLEDNNRFLENEARHVRTTAHKSLAQKNIVDSRSKSFDAVVTTPKKDRQGLPGFVDGFQADDVMLISPSKSRDRSKVSTPKKGEKRKRAPEQSPGQRLALEVVDHSTSPPIVEPGRLLKRSDSGPHNGVFIAPDDDRFELVQRLLNHRPDIESEDKFLEIMCSHVLPSKPLHKLSSVITEGLRQIPESESFALGAVNVLLAVWRSCLDESYYGPLNTLVETTSFTLSTRRLSFASKFTATLVPLLMETIDLVSVPIGRAHSDGSYELSPEAAKLQDVVSIDRCLELLSHVSTGCASARVAAKKPTTQDEAIVPEEPPLKTYWRAMAFDFVLVLLMKSQPLSTATTMLKILHTSCLKDSFGTVHHDSNGDVDSAIQKKRETDIVVRLLALLFDTPKPLNGGKEHSEVEVTKLRLVVLGLFVAMCATGSTPITGKTHGGELLATHKLAVGWLFRFLCESVNRLYDNPPRVPRSFLVPNEEESATESDDSPSDSTQPTAAQAQQPDSLHTLTTSAVNRTVRLLHHVLTTYAAQIDVRQKLAAVHGGNHKHLVGLARLAFSDQLCMEAGIEDAVVDAAHEILDGFLTFEEGEGLVGIFCSPERGRRETQVGSGAERGDGDGDG